jgi:Dpy-30 motif
MAAHAEFLRDTVGPILSQGIAECLVADPDDPVAFIGLWLQQYVRNACIGDKVRQEQAKKDEVEQKVTAAAAEEESTRQALVAHMKAVVQQVPIKPTCERSTSGHSCARFQTKAFLLRPPPGCVESCIGSGSQPSDLQAWLQIADLPGYPLDVWQAAVRSIAEHTRAAAAYAMVVAPPPEPEFAFPEEEEGEEALESDDEQLAEPAAAEGAGEQEEVDPDAEAAAQVLAATILQMVQRQH